jgi:hypothetical protein
MNSKINNEMINDPAGVAGGRGLSDSLALQIMSPPNHAKHYKSRISLDIRGGT